MRILEVVRSCLGSLLRRSRHTESQPLKVASDRKSTTPATTAVELPPEVQSTCDSSLSDPDVAAEPWRADPSLVERIDAALRDWQQGDIARPGLALHLARADAPTTPEASEAGGSEDEVVAIVTEFDAVVVTSQTCDVVRSSQDRPFVKVSPLVRLDGDALAGAKARRRPRYAAVPGGGEDAFADLDRETTLEKAVLVGLDRTNGCLTNDDSRRFGSAVARHFGRYAFPDEVTRSLEPLRKRLSAKAGKVGSAQGRRFDEIVQIRAQIPRQWVAPVHFEAQLTEPWV